jgi:hypothetical protein
MHEARAEAEAAAEGTVDASGAVTEHGRKREVIAAAASVSDSYGSESARQVRSNR